MKLTLKNGANTIVFAGGQSSKFNFNSSEVGIYWFIIIIYFADYAADLDKIIVYQQGWTKVKDLVPYNSL